MRNIEMISPEDEVVEVTDAGQMAVMVIAWQQEVMSFLTHLKDIPPGTEVLQDDQTTMVLEGDALAGFQLGLALALEEIRELPFSTISDSQSPDSDDSVHNTDPAVTSTACH